MTRHARYAALILGMALLPGCRQDAEEPAGTATLGVCLPDSVSMGSGDTLTPASQFAIYDAVLDSLSNRYGATALFLDPRVETVGRDLDSTRGHDPPLLQHLFDSGRFTDTCQVDEESRCDVDSTGVSIRFSGLLRVTGTDDVVVDVTQQTVRPLRDSSDWFFWATWVRYWIERDGRCWYVVRQEIKGTV